jgi:hypothetical protein
MCVRAAAVAAATRDAFVKATIALSKLSGCYTMLGVARTIAYAD